MPKKAARKLDLDSPVVQIQSKIQKTNTMPDKSWARIDSLLAPLKSTVALTPGTFAKPMLAKPSKSVAESLPKPGVPVTCEWKYDGERVQIHITDEHKISLFSRNGLDSTGRFPEVIEYFEELLAHPACKIKSGVLDSEACAFDRDLNKILPFQVLSKGRKRKGVQSMEPINNGSLKPACVFVFDCLMLNGKSLISESLEKRREILHECMPNILKKVEFAKFQDCKNDGDNTFMEIALENAIQDGTEGLMVKPLSSVYKIGSRTTEWKKLKKDYLEGIGDTLDLVPIGAYRGNGSRSNVYGSFLLASFNDKSKKFETVTKVGTGFTNDDLMVIKKKLNKKRIEEPKDCYDVESVPNRNEIVWFDTDFVWEIKCADFQLSKTYNVGKGMVGKGKVVCDKDKGISLRFPRYLRVRRDKKVEEATTSEQIFEMFQAQPIFN